MCTCQQQCGIIINNTLKVFVLHVFCPHDDQVDCVMPQPASAALWATRGWSLRQESIGFRGFPRLKSRAECTLAPWRWLYCPSQLRYCFIVNWWNSLFGHLCLIMIISNLQSVFIVCHCQISLTINPKDLKIETKRASGAGGQHVNTTDSAVRIVHLPSGNLKTPRPFNWLIPKSALLVGKTTLLLQDELLRVWCVCVCLGVVAECQQERSQLKNKEKAMKALRAKLYSMKLEEETSKRYNQRKIQVRSATCSVSTQQSKNKVDFHVLVCPWIYFVPILP